MKCKYEIRNIFSHQISDDEMKKIICEKIAKLINNEIKR